MNRKRSRLLLACGLIVLASQLGLAAPIMINFDDAIPGEIINFEYRALGITFEALPHQGMPYGNVEAYSYPWPWHCSPVSDPMMAIAAAWDDWGIRLNFSTPVTSLSLYGCDYGGTPVLDQEIATLAAYDSDSNLLGSTTVASTRGIKSLPEGDMPIDTAFLSLSGIGNIAYAEFTFTNTLGAFGIDDVEFTPLEAKAKVLLTFDDGPEGDEDKPGQFNSTSSILGTLSTNSVKSGIKATFFTLTHGAQWGGSGFGAGLLCTEYTSAHVVSIHQGGQGCKGPHTLQLHTKRVDGFAYPVGPNGEVLKKNEGDPNGLNRLESDLIAAIRRLRFLFGDPSYDPEFVRPPMYVYNDDVVAAYGSEAVKRELGNDVGLKMVLTDTLWGDGGGGPWPPSSQVSAGLKASVQNCIGKGIYEIVLTLHDSNDDTANNLETYLNDIIQAAQEKGYVVEFVTSDSEARQILRNRWATGDWQGG